MIPISEWLWSGWPGHFICASRCRFRLHTHVGNYAISTVGAMYPREEGSRGEPAKMETVGADRFYETYVFKLGEERCKEVSCNCQERLVSDWCEIDSLAANDGLTARINHYSMCIKYAGPEDTDAKT